MISRREFIINSGITLLSLKLIPFSLSEYLWAAVGGKSNKCLVIIFQRGAMDGLSFVPPVGDSNYYSARPHIAIPAQGDLAALKLDGYFGLHPACEPLKKYWDNGNLAFVHHVGSPSVSRSHFEAQDFMESGTPESILTQDGFLNRAMPLITPSVENSKLRAVAIQASMPRMLKGDFPAISMSSIHDFGIKGGLAKENEVAGFEAMYKQAANHVLQGQAEDAFAALKMVSQRSEEFKKKSGANPPKGIVKQLGEIAELIKSDVGMQVAVTEMQGWDTHVNQGAGQGQLAGRLGELSKALATFAEDLGPKFADVCVVTLTEFGRTVKENGSRGTDHGHGSVMSILGGPVKGKKVYGSWKPLSTAELFEERDVPVSTDYRLVLSEILGKHMGIPDFSQVFPGFKVQSQSWLDLLRS